MGDNINTVIINFSYEPEDINQLISSIDSAALAKSEIFDFTTTVSKNLNAKVLYPSDRDPDNKLHKEAIKDYINEMGLLSQVRCKLNPAKSIRSFKIFDLPIYWMTPVSQKNPQDSVLKNFYYFKFLLTTFDLKNRKLYIILPGLCFHFRSAITKFLLSHGLKTENIIFNNIVTSKFTFRGMVSYVKMFYKKLNQTRKHLPNLKTSTGFPQELIITGPGVWKEKEEKDIVLWGIERLSLSMGKSVKYLPVFFDYAELRNFKNNSKFDQYFFSCFPNKFQILSFFSELIRCYRQIQKVEFNLSEISFVDNEALRYEFNSVLHNKLEYFINYLWLKKYFSSYQNDTNVYYQDEFFNTGRLISESINRINSAKIHSYGVQHGLFYEAHTVYIITDNEIKSLENNDGIPIPKKFIVWGDYFKKLFQENNSLPQNYVIPAGHLDYIYRHQNLKGKSKKSNTNVKILWCATLKVDLVNMYQTVVKDFMFSHPEINLEIRFHPLVNLEEFVFTNLFDEDLKKRITVSRHESIFLAIEENDIILTSSGSTVFLDGLIARKTVFSFVNNDYYMGNLGKQEVTQISDFKDMERAYQDYLSGEETVMTVEHLIELNSARWEKIVVSNSQSSKVQL